MADPVPMGKLTAKQIITLVRDQLRTLDTNIYRDGFSTDLDTEPTSILDWVNQAFMQLIPTGFCKCTFDLPLVVGQAEYGLDPDIGDIEHVTINGLPLAPVTLLGQDARNAGWQATGTELGARPTALPTRYYATADILGFVATPDQVYHALIFADTIPATLTLANQVPSRLPSQFHSLLWVGATLLILNMETENAATAEKIKFLGPLWEAGVTNLKAMMETRVQASAQHVEVAEYRYVRGYRRY